ncbi:MAG: alginate export family protein [Verrucomicrobia bacterium]|nr:alginate export family protein [Verrucomicrobiota bacterium]
MNIQKRNQMNMLRLSCFVALATFATLMVGTMGAEEGASEKKAAWDILPNAIKEGKVNVNSLLRWEYADQESFGLSADPRESNAFTIRNRVGFTTGSFSNFKSQIEFEDVSIVGNEDNYNQAGLNPLGATRTVIADPEGTEVNQAWLAYENWDAIAKLGRQRIVLDGARFVGDVIWRQNQQTFDAVSLVHTGLADTSLYYAYISNVNRILGDDHPAGDFDSDSHILNASYSGLEIGKFTGYTYLLDLNDAPALSSATYGASFVGSTPVTDTMAATYHAEYAHQTDYQNSPLGYNADYSHLSLGAKHKKIDYGVGYEVLGSDGGAKGFSTPLATLHKFNGWADAFLGTPADGLEDLYAWFGVTLPGTVPVKFFYHDFKGETGGADYGQEYNVVASKKLSKNFAVLAKYAHYEEGDLGRAGRTRFWLQLAFNY